MGAMPASAGPSAREPGAVGSGVPARQFALLAAQLLAAGTVTEVLTHVALAAHRLLAVVDGVSVTVHSGGGFRTPVSLHPAAAELDQVQYDADAGPCLAAARMTGPGLVSVDVDEAGDWPVFARAAARRGYGSVLCAALAPDPGPAMALGALNLYFRRPHGPVAADRDVALLLATHGALALAHARALSYGVVQHGRLRKAALPR
ncbi:hypothetical protein CFP66_33830 [Pseudonocardia sp. MH-G8]|nr:hypothetical protein CFP66_33830 [Pseudonocardia sp. MH-G8]